MPIFAFFRLGLSAVTFNFLLSHILADCIEEKQYRVTFEFNWNRIADTDIPDDPTLFVGFKNILCVSHNANYTLWTQDNVTSPDLTNIIKNFNDSDLEATIRENGSYILDSFFLNDAEAEETKTSNITLKGEGAFTLLSCFANIEPSPGWFVGVDSLQLCVSRGSHDYPLNSRHSIEMKGWDSGIYSNEAYVNENLDEVSRPAAVRRLLGFAELYGKLTVESYDRKEPASSTSCFPADELISLPRGDYLPISALTISRVVLSQHTNATSPIFMFSHRHSDVLSRFVHLHFSDGRISGSLRTSPGHYIYRYKSSKSGSAAFNFSSVAELVTANQIRKGDALIGADGQPRLVERVSSTLARGLYNPHSLHGDLIVSGVRVSSYTSAVPPSVANSALAPVRLLYRLRWHSLSRLLSMYLLRGDWNQYLYNVFCLRC